MTTHPANDAAPALSLGAKATIQMGSLFIGCHVTEVSRTAHKAILTDSDGTTYPVSRGRDGVPSSTAPTAFASMSPPTTAQPGPTEE